MTGPALGSLVVNVGAVIVDESIDWIAGSMPSLANETGTPASSL
jgi:hypothetical protein